MAVRPDPRRAAAVPRALPTVLRTLPAPLRTLLAAALATALLAGVLSGCDSSPAEDGARPAGSAPSAVPSATPATSPSSSPSTSPSTGPSAPGSTVATSAPSSPGSRPRFTRYVALGDSYTAAPGVPGRTSQDGCFRSSGNYPHLLAAALPVARLVDVSCSGADTDDVRQRQAPAIAPQLDAVTRRTDLVTIGLGGNDEELFSRLLGVCGRSASSPRRDCFDSSGAGPVLDRIEEHLVEVVRAVRSRAPEARVLLVGYPQVLPPAGGCERVPFATGDRFARQVNHGLTEAVRRAASATGVTYVDVWSASAGHDLCSADPWINGASGAGAAPFHPFATEQQAVARLVGSALG